MREIRVIREIRERLDRQDLKRVEIRLDKEKTVTRKIPRKK